MRTYKKGISLIVLVITILVLAILATTVIISLSNTNIINEANNSVITTRFQSMQDQLALHIADQYAVTGGTFKLEDLDAEPQSPTIDAIFPELKDTKYYAYVSLVDGNIVLASGMPDRAIALQVIVEQEIVTNYTQSEVGSSPYDDRYAIGATNRLDVTGTYNEDHTILTITKNGATSDGKIKNSAYGSPDNTLEATTVIIEKGITHIGNWAFDSNSSLVTVYIPKGVTYIGHGAFAYLDNLTDIYYSGTKADWNQIVLCEEGDDGIKWNYGSSFTVHCTDGDIVNGEQEELEEPEVITNYTESEGPYGTVYAIGATNSLDVVGVYNAERTILTITKNSPTSDGKIKTSAYGSPNNTLEATTVILEKGITYIGDWAFDGNPSLVTVYIPKGVTYIGHGAFAYLYNLTDIYYSGTKADWNQIVLCEEGNEGIKWDCGSSYILHCTDGDIIVTAE